MAAAVSESAEALLPAHTPAANPAAGGVLLQAATAAQAATEGGGEPSAGASEVVRAHDAAAASAPGQAQPAPEPCDAAPAAEPPLTHQQPAAVLEDGEQAPFAAEEEAQSGGAEGLSPAESLEASDEAAGNLPAAAPVVAAVAADGEADANAGDSAAKSAAAEPATAAAAADPVPSSAAAAAEYPEGLLGESDEYDSEEEAGEAAGVEGDDVDALFAGMKLPD